MVVLEYAGEKLVCFPTGTDFDRIECAGGTLVADVMRDGKRADVVVIGPCPHCQTKEKSRGVT